LDRLGTELIKKLLVVVLEIVSKRLSELRVKPIFKIIASILSLLIVIFLVRVTPELIGPKELKCGTVGGCW
jgi:hypothetical protein